ncbi:metallopeptidase TldD-related protein [candidate division KSB1 bacterium]
MKNKIYLSIIVILFSVPAISQDKLSDILKEELNRNMEALKNEKTAPYYMYYRVNDIKTYKIETSFGQVMESGWVHNRRLCAQVRVGSNKIDNTHPIKGEDYGWFSWDRGIELPIENLSEGIKQVLWKETDKQYRKSADLYAKVVANIAVKVEDEDKSDDFSVEKPLIYYEAPLDEAKLEFEIKLWEEKLKNYSAIFLQNKDAIEGSAVFTYIIERKYFVSNDGSNITENRVTCRVMINGKTQADDGMDLPLHNSYFGFYLKDLPSDEVIINDTKKLSKTLTKLRSAPVVDSYTGPALLSAASAGVFFHEIFGHRIEGQRMKDEEDAQTFKKKVGEKVLNENLSIVFDPSISKYKNFFLNGAYKYDDQGQKGKRLIIVENGILKDFLMSRTPIEGFSNSNGHGRAQAGMHAVSRQSNMFVESNKPLTSKQLKQALIDEAKKQGKEYGYLFVSTVGGFTTTGRYRPNAFNVTPTEVYRIYTDGRPDELVRGVNLVGTPLSIFSNIESAGDDYGIFTGFCGAESGSVPVSTVCPTLFVKQIETQRKPKNQTKLPILSRP